MSSPSRRSPRRRVAAVAAALSTAAVLALATLTACAGPDTLNGTVRTTKADGKEGGPMTGGWLAVLTAEQLSDFLDQSGIDPPGADYLAFVEGRVRHEAVTESGGTLLPVDGDGKFSTTLTGPRQLCLLRELPQVDLLRGCAAVDLPADGRLDVTVGDAGLKATLHH